MTTRRSDRGVLFYRNVGTVAAPRLARAALGERGPRGQAARPGAAEPGRRDRLGRRRPARPDRVRVRDELPRLPQHGRGARNGRGSAPPAGGIALLRPWTAQTISGADAFDWDGDGREDVLTGQGHAGSGLRFYARGYLEDVVRGTLPRVTIEAVETRPSAWGPGGEAAKRR